MHSLGRLLELVPADRVHVIEDHRNPLPDVARGVVEGQGVMVRQGSTPYPKTLEQALLILGEHQNTARMTGASHVISLDADTVIKDPSRMDQAIADGFDGAGWASFRYYFYGACYMLSAEAIGAMIERSDDYRPYFSTDVVESDAVMGFLLDRVMGPDRVRRFWFDVRGGFMKSYHFDRDPMPLAEYAKRYDAVTFGRRDGMGVVASVEEGYARTAQAMGAFRGLIRGD